MSVTPSPVPAPAERTDRLMKVGELSKLLGLDVSSIYRHMGEPDFVPHVYIGKAVRFRESDVGQFISGLSDKKADRDEDGT